MLHIMPGNPRYAVRELQFMELYPPSSPTQTFSGTEFLGIIGKLEDYQRKQQAPEQPAEAGVPEPERRGPEVPPAERPTGDPEAPATPGQVNAGEGSFGVPGSSRPL